VMQTEVKLVTDHVTNAYKKKFFSKLTKSPDLDDTLPWLHSQNMTVN